MLNKLCQFIRSQALVQPGDTVICAVSGGADSMALLWGMYLLREKLQIHLQAAHFNHHLRGEESDRDEAFVAEFCDRFDIPLYRGQAQVVRGEKGLEAAAREARYSFFRTLPGKIATAHTANDNAETVLMNMLRGTALKGLGAIAPMGDNLIRPMLTTTRPEVLAFLSEYAISYVEDSSNRTDDFLRNRLRHGVMPLLEAENPRLAENLSAMALGLRQDAACLEEMMRLSASDSVTELRKLPQAMRCRVLGQFLKNSGVKEPTRRHIAQVDALVFSEKPSAKAAFPGGVCIERCYDRLQVQREAEPLEAVEIICPSVTELPHLGLRLVCRPAEELIFSKEAFTVVPQGNVILRCRMAGDEITLPGGTKNLKKLFVDAKIPAARRLQIPVLADEKGVFGVCNFGVNEKRKADTLPAVQFVFEKI